MFQLGVFYIATCSVLVLVVHPDKSRLPVGQWVNQRDFNFRITFAVVLWTGQGWSTTETKLLLLQ